mmetsp:Transcript_8163/g.20153  ORF Transcript_8163/g.20153 Transcript_8163/m.20153 type:complete len:382 (+) Transcript_8163:921-2066(+)
MLLILQAENVLDQMLLNLFPIHHAFLLLFLFVIRRPLLGHPLHHSIEFIQLPLLLGGFALGCEPVRDLHERLGVVQMRNNAACHLDELMSITHPLVVTAHHPQNHKNQPPRDTDLIRGKQYIAQDVGGELGIRRQPLPPQQQNQLCTECLHVRLDQCVVDAVDAQLLQHLGQAGVLDVSNVVLGGVLQQHLNLLRGQAIMPVVQDPSELVPPNGTGVVGVQVHAGLHHQPAGFGELVAEGDGDGLGGDLGGDSVTALVVERSSLLRRLDELRCSLGEGLVFDKSVVGFVGHGQQGAGVPLRQSEVSQCGLQQIRYLLVRQHPLGVLVTRLEHIHQQSSGRDVVEVQGQPGRLQGGPHTLTIHVGGLLLAAADINEIHLFLT